MKLTPYKLARVKNALPQEDRERVEKEIKEGELSPEMKSKIDSWLRYFTPNSRKRKNGAFGKRGTNRKAQLLEKKKEIVGLLEEAKKEEDSPD